MILATISIENTNIHVSDVNCGNIIFVTAPIHARSAPIFRIHAGMVRTATITTIYLG